MFEMSRLVAALCIACLGSAGLAACGDNTIDARDIALEECQDTCLIKQAIRCSGDSVSPFVVDCQNACYDAVDVPQHCAEEVNALWLCRVQAHYYCHRTGPNTTEATWGEFCQEREKALTLCEGLTDAP